MANKEEYLERLKELKLLNDPEIAHEKADKVLLELLVDLDYKDIVEAYREIERWYS